MYWLIEGVEFHDYLMKVANELPLNSPTLENIGLTVLDLIASLPEPERTKVQKIDIVLRSSELIRVLEEEAVEYRSKRKPDGTFNPSGSTEPVTKRTNERIGEMTGTAISTNYSFEIAKLRLKRPEVRE